MIKFYATIGNETRTLREWAKISGVSYDTLHYRYKTGVRGCALINRKNRKQTNLCDDDCSKIKDEYAERYDALKSYWGKWVWQRK